MINQEDKTMTKKFYNQPEMQIASVETGTVMLAESPDPAISGAGKLNTDVLTDDQW